MLAKAGELEQYARRQACTPKNWRRLRLRWKKGAALVPSSKKMAAGQWDALGQTKTPPTSHHFAESRSVERCAARQAKFGGSAVTDSGAPLPPRGDPLQRREGKDGCVRSLEFFEQRHSRSTLLR